MKKPKLQKKYEKIVNEYIDKFVSKHKYEFTGWVTENDIGTGIAVFIDQYFFSFNDIAYDINNECPKGLIFKWQDHNLEVGTDNAINYYSYTKGLRMNVIKSKNSSTEGKEKTQVKTVKDTMPPPAPKGIPLNYQPTDKLYPSNPPKQN